MDKALVPGRRLDERKWSHRFGLPIARERAELHGGKLELTVLFAGRPESDAPATGRAAGSVRH